MSHAMPLVSCHANTQDLADIYVSAIHRIAHLEPEPNPYSVNAEPWYDANEVECWLDNLAVSTLREYERQCGHWNAEQLEDFAKKHARDKFTVYHRTVSAWSAYVDDVNTATEGTRWDNTLEFAPGVHGSSRTKHTLRSTLPAATRQMVNA